MVRPLLLTAGSRGDVEPVLALAESPDLDDPVLFVQRDLLFLAPQAHVLPFEMTGLAPLYAYSMKHAGENEHPFETIWRACVHVSVQNILPAVDSILDVACNSHIDVVLTTSMTCLVAHFVAEKMSVPLVMLTFQPIISSKLAPHLCLMPKKAATAFEKILKGETPDGNDENYESYSRLHRVVEPVFLNSMNENRRRLGPAPVNGERITEIMCGTSDVTSLVACSPQLTPALPDWKPQNMIVGSLASSFTPKDYRPNEAHPDLCRFLDEGPPPVVVSFGSMRPMVGSAKLTSTILTGLRDVNIQRIVLIPGAAGLDVSLLEQDSELVAWASRVVFTARAPVQYSYLLPRAALLLCHGGAGTTMAALYAGIPLVITPVMADQQYYAEMMCRLRFGASTPMGLDNLEPDMVANAVKSALSEQVKENVLGFSKREREAVSPVTCVVRALADIAKHSKDGSTQANKVS